MITIKSTGGTSPMIVQQPAGGKVLKLERWGVFVMCSPFLEPRRKRWGFVCPYSCGIHYSGRIRQC